MALDASAHEVKLAGGEEISYGKCLLATGSVPFIPPIAGMEDRTNVHTFITLDDALAAWTMCSQQPSVRMRKAVKAVSW